MPSGLAGQYQLEYLISGYTSPVREHALRFNIFANGNPVAGTPANDIDIQLKGGTTAKLDAIATQLWSYLRLCYHTSTSAGVFTLWKWATNTARDFVSSGSPADPAGNLSGSVNVAGQTTLTFRSGNGGTLNIVMIESGLTGNNKDVLVPDSGGTNVQRLAAFVLSSGSPVMSRDNAFAVAALRDSRGQNEASWRKVFRA